MPTKRPVLVMGPGCGRAELEHCPPEYHFELTHDELMNAILYPENLARDLGLANVGPFKNIHLDLSQGGNAIARERTIYCCKTCLTDSLC
jgi:hypothetical protein